MRVAVIFILIGLSAILAWSAYGLRSSNRPLALLFFVVALMLAALVTAGFFSWL